MIRQICLVAFLAASFAMSAAASTKATWKFDVFLDDKQIGFHEFVLSSEDENYIIETEAKFDVKLLFVNVFRYRHENTEVWEGDCLSSIDSQTTANGKDFAVRGKEVGSAFSVDSANRVELPDCIMTFAYWNPSILAANRLLNSQTGEYEEITVIERGLEKIIVEGERIDARKYVVSAESGDITVWYAADDNRWLALESKVDGGRTLRYKPVTVPVSVPDSLILASLDSK